MRSLRGANENSLIRAVISRLTMVVSDGILKNGVGYPHVAGTYAQFRAPTSVSRRHSRSWKRSTNKTQYLHKHLETRVPEMVATLNFAPQ